VYFYSGNPGSTSGIWNQQARRFREARLGMPPTLHAHDSFWGGVEATHGIELRFYETVHGMPP